MSDSRDKVAKAQEESRRNYQRTLKGRQDLVDKFLSFSEKYMIPSNPPEAVVPNNKKEGETVWNPPSEDRPDRIDWSKFSARDMDEFIRTTGWDLVKLMLMNIMGPQEKHDFIGGLTRLAMERIHNRAEVDKLMRELEPSMRLAEDLGRLEEARVALGISRRAGEASEGQNVTPEIPQNRNNVTVVAPNVTHHVALSSPVVRAKRGEDGLYRCRECDYVTHRAGTLRMHRFRKHSEGRT